MKPKGRLGAIITAVVCVVLVVLAGGLVYLQIIGAQDYDAKTLANMEKRDALQAELDSIQETVMESEEVEEVVYSAADAGTQVANFQNMYATVRTDGIAAVAEQIDPYLSADSKAMRVPWFTGPVLQGAVEWRFETTYSFSGKNVPVLWTCWDVNDMLMAYAIGQFDVDTKTFSDVEHFITLNGQNSLPPETSGNTASPSPNPNDVAGNVLGNLLGGTPVPSVTPSATPDVSSSEADPTANPSYPPPQVSNTSSPESSSSTTDDSEVSAEASVAPEGDGD